MVEREKVFPQSAQRKGRSPVCTRQWSFMWCRNLNALPQNSHLKGRSPVWTGRCAISEPTSGNDFPQNLHSTTLDDVPTSGPPAVAVVKSNSIAEFSCGEGSGISCRLPKWVSMRFSGSVGMPAAASDARDWCWCKCTCSRYFKVSRLWDRMWRVSLLW